MTFIKKKKENQAHKTTKPKCKTSFLCNNSVTNKNKCATVFLLDNNANVVHLRLKTIVSMKTNARNTSVYVVTLHSKLCKVLCLLKCI